ncbi:ATP-binding protein [Actinacidiphila soli]|uniref:ATP-binding protein n=1 Tax=Actinacidiphila soli TaxID=2487275 RepID=UPI000FCADC19|nr:ATP-binding protein [Actinacidiphila soli]
MHHLDVIDGSADEHEDPPLECVCRPRRAFEAREAASAFLARLRPAPSPEATHTFLLVVSELVTNAIRYAGGSAVLRLTADRHSLTVAVEDPSPDRPRERTPDLTGRTGGFGWPMVQRLARYVYVQPRPYGGKVVRAVLAR